MAEKTSPENQLMRAVLLQNLGEDGTSTLKIDNEKLMEQLGVSSSGAAAKRWSRFKKRLVEEGVTPKGSDVANGASPKKKGGVAMATDEASAKKKAAAKKRKHEGDGDIEEDAFEGY